MARAKANKNYRTFVAGLVTEASPLTYPENASQDEDNLVHFKKGNTTRRLGFDAEPNLDDQDYFIREDFLHDGMEIAEYSWESVNEKSNVDLLVFRAGDYLYFYRHLPDSTVSNQKISFYLNLRNFVVDADKRDDLKYSRISITSGKGYLFIAGALIKPLSLQYDETTETCTVREVNVLIRDFVGVDDGLAVDDEPTVLTNDHLYNLRNQGWISANKSSTGGIVTAYNPFGLQIPTASSSNDPITAYHTQFSRYPGNNKQWWVGRLEVDDDASGLKAGEFDPNLLEEYYFGNTRAPRGHFIVDAFNIDRSDVSGVNGLPVEKKTSQPTAIGFYAGRVWYGHESTIFFSQVLEDYRQAGNCYQEADPTSESISDLISTDGGVIPIPDAYNIIRMYPIGGGLLILCENGLWFINGGPSVAFTATDISVTKISSNGILGPDTLVEADGTIYWWSEPGIMSMKQTVGVFGSQEGAFDRVNITEETIQSFYINDIPEYSKLHAKGVYDPIRNVVQWLYASEKVGSRKCYYDKILNLSIDLAAFYPWSISSGSGKPFICGVFNRVDVKKISPKGFTTTRGKDVFNTLINYVFIYPSAPNRVRVGFGDFHNTEYTDWKFFDSDGIGFSYLSFLETGFELLEDLMRDKQQNYVYTYFRRTEDTISDDGENGNERSSCFFQTKYDWSNSEISNRWSRKVQAYRRARGRKPQVAAAGESYDDGFQIIVSKHKVRGQGKAIQLRFETDEIDRNFDLLGWASHYTGETDV